MAAQPQPVPQRLAITKLETIPNLRVLAWNGDVLYASRGYTLLKARPSLEKCSWTEAGSYQPDAWRSVSSCFRLASRLVRNGFHALAVHPGGNMVGAVPGAIVTQRSGESEFHLTHRILRGT